MTHTVARILITIMLLNFLVTTVILLHDFERSPRDYLEVICLDGVEYYYKNFGVRSALAARLSIVNNEIKLVQCVEPTVP